MITLEQAETFVRRAAEFDDGQDPEVLRYEVRIDRGVVSVVAYNWSVQLQRRIWKSRAIPKAEVIAGSQLR